MVKCTFREVYLYKKVWVECRVGVLETCVVGVDGKSISCHQVGGGGWWCFRSIKFIYANDKHEC